MRNRISNEITPKKWSFAFAGMVVIGMILLGLYNYRTDSYFMDELCTNWSYSQYSKAKYIGDNPQKYNCFIIGGSNSGIIDPELIDKYTGYNSFSLSFVLGNYYNYYDYTKYLIENTDVKCIILHLSSTEVTVKKDYVQNNESLRLPASVTGRKFVDELCTFLFQSINSKVIDKNYTIKENGQLDWSYWEEQFKDNPEEYVNTHIIHDHQIRLSELDVISLNQQLIGENINYMKEIVDLCNQNNVELIVINGPIFTPKRSKFECNAYYDYLEKLVKLTEVWDFSGFTDINNNPYNFLDTDHYNGEVADEMIKYIFNDSYIHDDFGILLSEDNIREYIYKRKLDLENVKNEFRETNTIKMGGYDDKSRIISSDN